MNYKHVAFDILTYTAGAIAFGCWMHSLAAGVVAWVALRYVDIAVIGDGK